ncbi:MAG: thioredoxin family protein [Desulfococcaceae bacterium]
MKLKSIVLIMFLWYFAGTGLGQAEERVSPAKADAGNIAWLSYEEGLSRGKTEKKKIFLNFYADWCQYCKIMDMQTFRDSSVVKYLNENFISVRINSDHNRKIAADYNVTGLPVSWFVAENGENIGSQPGFIPPDALLPLLKYIHTDSYKKMNFTQFMEKM